MFGKTDKDLYEGGCWLAWTCANCERTHYDLFAPLDKEGEGVALAARFAAYMARAAGHSNYRVFAVSAGQDEAVRVIEFRHEQHAFTAHAVRLEQDEVFRLIDGIERADNPSAGLQALDARGLEYYAGVDYLGDADDWEQLQRHARHILKHLLGAESPPGETPAQQPAEAPIPTLTSEELTRLWER